MKKLLLIALILLLLPFGQVRELQAAKLDNKGENLNFAPTVDFELKEKKKVDVIVDVGNTNYTVEQVNSMVNEQLRPQLQASGIDYKLYIEKSSEGTTKLYYDLPTIREGYDTSRNGVYEYDIVTKQKKKLPNFYEYRNGVQAPINVKIRSGEANSSLFVDPINNMLVFNSDDTGARTAKGYYKNLDSVTGEVFPVHFTSNLNFFQLENGKYYFVTPSGNNQLNLMKVEKNENGQFQFIEELRQSFSLNSYGNFIVPGVDDALYPVPVNTSADIAQMYRLGINADGSLNGDRTRYTNFSSYLNDPTYDYHFQNTMVRLLPQSESIIYAFRKNKNFLEGGESLAPGLTNKIPSLARWNPRTNTHDIIVHSTNNERIYGSRGDFITLSDDRLVYRACSEDYTTMTAQPTDCELRIIDDLDKPSEYRVLYTYSLSLRDVIDNVLAAQKAPSLLGVVGNNIVLTLGSQYSAGNGGNNLQLLTLNADTAEVTLIDSLTSDMQQYSLNHFRMFDYPAWYISEKRYIVDILEEVPYRSDAEKYYIRLDDHNIAHLDSNITLGQTIQTLATQNITYMGIGNDTNKAITDKILQALGQDLFFSIADAPGAFKQIASYITERKEVDLHVLIGSITQTLDAIKTQVNNLVTQLKAKNIIVTPHYVQGTSNSKFRELLNQVSWSEEKNNYIYLVQDGLMDDMKVELAQEEVVQLLQGNYAHLLWLGATRNSAIGNQLLTLLEGDGIYDSGSSLTNFTPKAITYIEQSAVQNPKRVHNLLVLKHDPLTGEYSSEISVETFYEDFETDRKRNERFKTSHDPTVYENHTGVMDGIGIYQDLPTTRFTKVGLYEMVVQVQDEPIADSKLSEYWLWSKDSLSRLMLYVHRQPVAEFTATVNASRRLTITDYSYDLDRYSRANKGIATWEWKWKKIEDEAWTAGQAPATLAANTDYLVSLKVKDIDGAWSNETIRFVTTNPYNQPPVALFTVEPANISHRATSTITDRSYDPDGDRITERTWIATKDGVQIWNSGTQPTSAQLQNAAVTKSLSKLGTYLLQLRVKDAPGEWSPWYNGQLEVVNYAPIANFEPLTETYRDTLNTVINLTANPDLDGDPVSYEWQLYYNGKAYNQGTAKDASFTIKSKGLGKAAVGNWNLQLKATDPLGAFSYMSYDFDVVNQVPETQITSGRDTGYINAPYVYTSSRTDADSEDIASLQSYWKLTSPSGRVTQWNTQNITIMYDEKGEYRLDNWVVDQLGAKSEVKTMNIRVLNMLPIPGFTMNPNPTYRGTSIDFISSATDFDGYIDKHAYFVTMPNGTTTMISELGDFKRAFSTVGALKVRQTVTDNDGAIAELEKTVTIMNHPPTVQIITPNASSPNTPTLFQSVTPRIHWTMSDIEQDPQTMYQLTLRTADNQSLYSTNQVSSRNAYFDIPSSWKLQENTVYAITVAVYDGYDWSVPSAPKYFIIQLNQAPEPGFSWLPSIVWEGDAVSIRHAVNDPDQDQLTVSYSVKPPNGATMQYPSNGGSYSLAPSNYTSHAFTLSNVAVGAYTITQAVTDGKSEAVRLSQTIHVGQLSVLGHVRHTDLWESYRNEFNEQAVQSGKDIWLPEQFYAGEKFLLSAITTDTKSTSNEQTYANKVTATFNGKYMTELQYVGEHKWSAELWHTDFTALAKGTYPILFTATYSNGTVKTHQIEVEIIGNANAFVSVHRWK